MFSAIAQTATKEQRKLLKLYSALNQSDRETLMKFAEFLQAGASESKSTESAEAGSEAGIADIQPRPIPRPAGESVIKAIKRLSATYHMIDKSVMLDRTSSLMSQHLLQGRVASDVIDDLEAAFEEAYQNWRRDRQGS